VLRDAEESASSQWGATISRSGSPLL